MIFDFVCQGSTKKQKKLTLITIVFKIEMQFTGNFSLRTFVLDLKLIFHEKIYLLIISSMLNPVRFGGACCCEDDEVDGEIKGGDPIICGKFVVVCGTGVVE